MGIAGEGATLAEAFEQAAHALVAVITDAPIESRQQTRIHCEAPNVELLFVDWLNALVYEMSTRHEVFGAFSVTIDGAHLDAVVSGERVDRPRHQPAVEVKGATYTALSVARTPDGGWRAQCVVDV